MRTAASRLSASLRRPLYRSSAGVRPAVLMARNAGNGRKLRRFDVSGDVGARGLATSGGSIGGQAAFRMLPGGGSLRTAQNNPKLLTALTNSSNATGFTT